MQVQLSPLMKFVSGYSAGKEEKNKMKEQVKYVVWFDESHAEDVIADDAFGVHDGFVEFYVNEKLSVMYNTARVWKIEVK